MKKLAIVGMILAAALGLSLWLLMPRSGQGLVLYSAVDYGPGVARAFTKRTGIPVKVVELSTGALLARVSAEGLEPGPGAAASVMPVPALPPWPPATAQAAAPAPAMVLSAFSSSSPCSGLSELGVKPAAPGSSTARFSSSSRTRFEHCFTLDNGVDGMARWYVTTAAELYPLAILLDSRRGHVNSEPK